MPSMQGFGSRRLMANPCTGDNCANATAAMRWLFSPSVPCSRAEGERSLRLVGRGLLAFGTEFLALLAVKSLGVGLLGAFERRRGPRLLGLLFGRRGRRFCGWRGSSRRGGLRERRTHQEQGCECGRGRAGR